METGTLLGHYDSYLLRIWRGGKENRWRWMLQNVRTGEQMGFRDMEALVRYLDATYGENADGISRPADLPRTWSTRKGR